MAAARVSALIRLTALRDVMTRHATTTPAATKRDVTNRDVARKAKAAEDSSVASAISSVEVPKRVTKPSRASAMKKVVVDSLAVSATSSMPQPAAGLRARKMKITSTKVCLHMIHPVFVLCDGSLTGLGTFLSVGVDYVQQYMGGGDQSNESAIEQAKDEQISDFIRGQYKSTTGKEFPVKDK